MTEEMKSTENNTAKEKKRKVLVEVKNLTKYFPVRSGLFKRTSNWVKAVDDVSFFIYEGESFGLVGESGCGKTTVGRTILRLIPATSGSVHFEDRDVYELSGKDLKQMRRDMQIIFQDPYSSLDPRMPVGESIAEGLRIHTDKSGQERYDTVIEMLSRVGLRADHARRYPHEFSGGQRQRIGIARALALRPKFIVCDEPVSALDVSIQAQIINFIRKIFANLTRCRRCISQHLGKHVRNLAFERKSMRQKLEQNHTQRKNVTRLVEHALTIQRAKMFG